MKLKAIFTTILAALWLSAGARAADTYNIDPMHSTVGFSIAHLVINNVQGKFGEFTGTVVVEAAPAPVPESDSVPNEGFNVKAAV